MIAGGEGRHRAVAHRRQGAPVRAKQGSEVVGKSRECNLRVVSQPMSAPTQLLVARLRPEVRYLLRAVEEQGATIDALEAAIAPTVPRRSSRKALRLVPPKRE